MSIIRKFIFLFTFVISSIIFCITASADATITLSAVNAPVDPDAEAINTQYIGTPSAYYAKFLVTLNGLSNQKYLVFYFNEYCTFNIPLSGTITYPCTTPATSVQRGYTQRNNPNLSWSAGNYLNWWSTSGNIYVPYTNGETWQIVDYTVSLSYSGQVLEPDRYIDNIYCNVDGYNINFGVEATPNSQFVDTMFKSQEYTVSVLMQVGNNTYNIPINSLMYYLPAYNTVTTYDDNGDIDLVMFQDTPKMVYWDKMQALRVYRFEYAVNAPPDSSSGFSKNWASFKSENIITLNQIYNYYVEHYDANADKSVIFTEYKVRFYNGNNVAESFDIDFTLESGQSVPDIPPDDTGTPNQTDPFNDLNATLTSNNYYLRSIEYGKQYLSNGMSELIYKVDFENINNFEIPEFELISPDYDANTLSWFSNFVEWWYSTPFGFIAIAALTILIIKTIIW